MTLPKNAADEEIHELSARYMGKDSEVKKQSDQRRMSMGHFTSTGEGFFKPDQKKKVVKNL